MKLIWSMNAQRESKGYRKAGAEVVWYGKKGDDIDKDVLNAWRKAGWIIRIEPDLPVKKKPEELFRCKKQFNGKIAFFK